MKNSDSSQLGVIYENIVLMKRPIGGMRGDLGSMMRGVIGGLDEDEYEDENEYEDEDDYEGGSEYEDEGEYEDDHNPEEEDPSEIHMARAELKKLREYSDKLYDKIGEMEGLEGWVASKITKAADYLSSVFHWLDYEHGDDSDCVCEHDDEGEYEDEYEDEDEDSETLRY
jgi:hypothetical protein